MDLLTTFPPNQIYFFTKAVRQLILFIATTNNVSTATPCGGKWRDQLCDRSTNVHTQDIYDSTRPISRFDFLKSFDPDNFKTVWLL